MPFTPFHLGAGALFKAVGRGRVSFLVFAGSQVLIDIEPLIRILSESERLHGPTHTFLGALAIGAVAAVIGRPISNFFLRWTSEHHRLVTQEAAWWGAMLGTFSHVVLDGMMHWDMQPFSPFSEANPLLGTAPFGSVSMLCLVLGGVGLVVWGVRISVSAKPDSNRRGASPES